MLNVLGISGPIFIIILLGFLATRLGLLKPQEAKPLGIFVIQFALPALLFRALAHSNPSHLLADNLIPSYAMGSTIVFICATFALSLRHGLKKAVSLGVGTALSNSAFMGLPIADEVFGSQATNMLAVYVFVENLILVPLLLIIGEIKSTREGHWLRILRDIGIGLIRNPLVLAMTAGMVFSIFNLPIAPPLERTINLLAAASAPTALFYIGCTLAGMRLKVPTPDLLMIASTKLLLHPLAVFLAFHFLSSSDDETIKAATLNAAMPMATIYPLLGQRYGQEGPCSAVLLLTTTLSFFSISTLLWLLSP